MNALLVIDIQNDYFAQGAMPCAGSGAACANARLLLDDFRKEQLPILHIRHVAARPDALFFLPETYGAEIHADVAPLAGETVIVKSYPNSFRNTDLLTTLHDFGVTELIVSGMMTHMCIDATVRAAKDYGFTVEVIGDACATRDLMMWGNTISAEKVHGSFLAAMSYFYATVSTTKEYIDRSNIGERC